MAPNDSLPGPASLQHPRIQEAFPVFHVPSMCRGYSSDPRDTDPSFWVLSAHGGWVGGGRETISQVLVIVMRLIQKEVRGNSNSRREN